MYQKCCSEAAHVAESVLGICLNRAHYTGYLGESLKACDIINKQNPRKVMPQHLDQDKPQEQPVQSHSTILQFSAFKLRHLLAPTPKLSTKLPATSSLLQQLNFHSGCIGRPGRFFPAYLLRPGVRLTLQNDLMPSLMRQNEIRRSCVGSVASVKSYNPWVIGMLRAKRTCLRPRSSPPAPENKLTTRIGWWKTHWMSGTARPV